MFLVHKGVDFRLQTRIHRLLILSLLIPPSFCIFRDNCFLSFWGINPLALFVWDFFG
jgi:hypothetical protein